MKNTLLCLFSIIFLFSMMPTAQAGFLIKKQVLTAITTGHHTEVKNVKAVSIFSRLVNHNSRPYYPFAYGGWVGIVALLCGIGGLFYGGFAVAAILFGFWGMGRRHKNKGMAIAGLVLGLFAILLSVFTTFSGFPIF